MNLHQLTLNEIKELQEQKLKELVEHAGTLKHLAFMLETPLPTVCGWVERGRISKSGARLVESHNSLGELFKAEELRPDLIINN